jgi:hypothetical protein
MRRGTNTVAARDIASADLEREMSNAVRDIRNLLKKIEKGVKEEDRRFKEDSTNWGYLGDLGHVKSELKDIAEFLNVE